jgi:hypothetical protein
MTAPIEYGYTEEVCERSNIKDAQAVAKSYRVVRTVFTDDKKKALAEVLRLFDEVDDPAIMNVWFKLDVKTKRSKFNIEVGYQKKNV